MITRCPSAETARGGVARPGSLNADSYRRCRRCRRAQGALWTGRATVIRQSDCSTTAAGGSAPVRVAVGRSGLAVAVRRDPTRRATLSVWLQTGLRGTRQGVSASTLDRWSLPSTSPKRSARSSSRPTSRRAIRRVGRISSVPSAGACSARDIAEVVPAPPRRRRSARRENSSRGAPTSAGRSGGAPLAAGVTADLSATGTRRRGRQLVVARRSVGRFRL